MSAVVQFEKPNEKTITIGKSKTGTVQLNVLKLVETRMLIQANSGGGKSTLMRLVVERAAGKIPFIILDWEGEFITLREKLDVVLVGSDGEIATDVHSAKLLARKLVELHASAVIDLSDLETTKRRQYVQHFLDSLINLPRSLWHATIVCIDEAHQLCPESGKVESAQAVINLLSLGRKRGLCGLLSTQRLSKLHKDAASECNNVFIGRTVLDNDQQRAGDVLGMNKADRLRLRDLAEGEFHAFGSALSLKGVHRFQADLPETKAPKVGERHHLTTAKASDVVSHIVTQLADLPQKAEAEIKSLEQAQKRIAELERAQRTRVAAQTTAPAVERNEWSLGLKQLEQKHRRELDRQEREANERYDKMVGIYENTLDELRRRLSEISRLATLTTSGQPLAHHLGVEPKTRPQLPVTPKLELKSITLQTRQIKNHTSSITLGKCERAILTVLAQYPHGKPKAKVAVIAGYSHKGGGFNNSLGSLRSKGFIEGSQEHLQITGAGVDALGDFHPLPTGRELAAYWMSQLGKAERSILDALVLYYPNAMTKDELGRYTGYESSGGGFNNALGKLRTLELISGTREALKASENLF
jgi:hypothetical protein